MRLLARLVALMDNRAGSCLGRLMCMRGFHTVHCRGRADHTPESGVFAERWL